jgi:hypothetical protein
MRTWRHLTKTLPITTTTASLTLTLKTTKNNKKHPKATKSKNSNPKQNRRKLSAREEKANERVNSLSTMGKTGKLLRRESKRTRRERDKITLKTRERMDRGESSESHGNRRGLPQSWLQEIELKRVVVSLSAFGRKDTEAPPQISL